MVTLLTLLFKVQCSPKKCRKHQNIISSINCNCFHLHRAAQNIILVRLKIEVIIFDRFLFHLSHIQTHTRKTIVERFQNKSNRQDLYTENAAVQLSNFRPIRNYRMICLCGVYKSGISLNNLCVFGRFTIPWIRQICVSFCRYE